MQLSKSSGSGPIFDLEADIWKSSVKPEPVDGVEQVVEMGVGTSSYHELLSVC